MNEGKMRLNAFLLITVVGLAAGGCPNDEGGTDGHAEAFRDGTLTQVLSNLLGQEMRGNPPPVSNVHAAVLNVNQQHQQSQQFRQSQEYGGPPPPLPPPQQEQQYNNNNNNIQQQYGGSPQESQVSSGTPFPGIRTSKGSRTFGFEFSFGDRIKPLQRGPRPPPPPAKVMQQQQQQQYGPPPSLPQQHDKFRQGPVAPAYGPPNANQQQQQQGGYAGNQNQQQQYGPPAQQQQQYGVPQMQMMFIPQVIPQMQQQQQQYGVPGGFQQIRMNFPVGQFQQQQQQQQALSGPLRTLQQEGIDSNSIADGGPSVDTKFVYLFAPPADPSDDAPQKPQVISYPGAKRDKNYQIIFVKAPGGQEPRPVEIQMPPQPEQKTMVYVLVKKPLRNGPNIRFTSPPSTAPPPPEVFFVKYKRNENMPSTSEFRSLPESIQDNLMDSLGNDDKREDEVVATGGYRDSSGQQQGIKQRGEKLRSTSDMGFIRSSSSGGYSRQGTSSRSSSSHYRAPGSRPWEEERQSQNNGSGGGYGKK